MKTGRLFSGSGLIALLFLLVAHAASAQDSRGSTGAVSLLNRVSAAVAGANAVEYISTVRSIDRTGQAVTLYVHAKIRKPLSLHVTVSPKATDATDAVVIVSDGTTITGFDPKLGLVTHHAVDFSGPSLVLPPGFEMVGAAFPTVRQVFGSAPFDALFYGTAHAPMTLVRHGVDVPGTLLIDARWPTELVGQERIARLYVDTTATTPRRLLLGSAADGHDSLQYVEDFSVFTLNPSLPDDTFHWTPPASLSLPRPLYRLIWQSPPPRRPSSTHTRIDARTFPQPRRDVINSIVRSSIQGESISPVTKIALVCCATLGSLPPVSARPILHNRPQTHHRSPVGVARLGSNGVTTREVYLWRQPAKIEPHLRDVPRGKPIEVVGSQRGFYAVIMHDGLRGWMPMDAVRPR